MDKRKMKKLLILNLPYFLVGLFATNLGEAWRLAEGADSSAKILSFFHALPIALNNPFPSFHPLDLLIGILCGAGLRLAVYLKGKNAKKYRHNVEYGSARCGAYTDIELTFKVYDSNDWSADPVGKETIHVYPYGEENAVAFVREAQATDNVIIDNDYVTVIVTGYEDDEIWGYTANLFLLNKTDKTVMFSVDDASVNGFMADPFYATSVSAGKCAFSSMAWSDTTLEENGITEVEEIEVLFRAYDADDFMGEDFANEVITLNP